MTLGTGTLSILAVEEQPKRTGHLEIVAREDLVDRRRRYILGAIVRCIGGVPSGFPHHVHDSGLSHHFSVIPTAGGTASAAVAQPRIAAVCGQSVKIVSG
jgi:hypothetical protein